MQKKWKLMEVESFFMNKLRHRTSFQQHIYMLKETAREKHTFTGIATEVWPIVRQPISVQSCTHATLCLE
jgi:hypothetical protein